MTTVADNIKAHAKDQQKIVPAQPRKDKAGTERVRLTRGYLGPDGRFYDKGTVLTFPAGTAPKTALKLDEKGRPIRAAKTEKSVRSLGPISEGDDFDDEDEADE